MPDMCPAPRPQAIPQVGYAALLIPQGLKEVRETVGNSGIMSIAHVFLLDSGE